MKGRDVDYITKFFYEASKLRKTEKELQSFVEGFIEDYNEYLSQDDKNEVTTKYCHDTLQCLNQVVFLTTTINTLKNEWQKLQYVKAGTVLPDWDDRKVSIVKREVKEKIWKYKKEVSRICKNLTKAYLLLSHTHPEINK